MSSSRYPGRCGRTDANVNTEGVATLHPDVLSRDVTARGSADHVERRISGRRAAEHRGHTGSAVANLIQRLVKVHRQVNHRFVQISRRVAQHVA